MAGLRDRLQWDATQGTVADGPRRYLLMRPDVLMGAAVLLDASARHAFFDAWARSTAQHAGDSLRAYAAAAPGDHAALLTATAAAAADLGWGHWSFEDGAAGLALQVRHSPFVDGWLKAAGGASACPVCAPVQGLFSALLALVQPGSQAEEVQCAALGATRDAARDGDGPVCRLASHPAP